MYYEEDRAMIDREKRILEMAKELGTNVVTTHIGVVPTDKSVDRYKIMQDACGELSEYADSMGAHFAIETGPERADVLLEFLKERPVRKSALRISLLAPWVGEVEEDSVNASLCKDLCKIICRVNNKSELISPLALSYFEVKFGHLVRIA